MKNTMHHLPKIFEPFMDEGRDISGSDSPSFSCLCARLFSNEIYMYVFVCVCVCVCVYIYIYVRMYVLEAFINPLHCQAFLVCQSASNFTKLSQLTFNT